MSRFSLAFLFLLVIDIGALVVVGAVQLVQIAIGQ